MFVSSSSVERLAWESCWIGGILTRFTCTSLSWYHGTGLDNRGRSELIGAGRKHTAYMLSHKLLLQQELCRGAPAGVGTAVTGVLNNVAPFMAH